MSAPAPICSTQPDAIFKHIKMLRERGQRHCERLGQGGDRSGAAGEPPESRPARGIGEGLKNAVERRELVRHIPFPFK
jgi:hypothetical protein